MICKFGMITVLIYLHAYTYWWDFVKDKVIKIATSILHENDKYAERIPSTRNTYGNWAVNIYAKYKNLHSILSLKSLKLGRWIYTIIA